jgi:hypothetical protein
MLMPRMIESVKTQNWSALLGELAIVVLGIFIALQVDSWWQGQEDLQQEQVYIDRLIDDFEKDSSALAGSVELARMRQGFADLLMEVADNPSAARKRPAEFLAAIDLAAYTYTPAVNSHTFEELRSTGNLGLLRNAELKSALFSYYQYDETSRQWIELFLKSEFEHFRLSSGVLANDLHIWAQDNVQSIRPNDPSVPNVPQYLMPAVMAAAQLLGEKTEFVAFLPRSRRVQLDLIDMNGSRHEIAEEILTILREED